MSWSVSFVGKPEKVAEALTEYSGKMQGQSKIEYDKALPHMIGAANLNYGSGYIIRLTASGSAYKKTETEEVSQFSINIETLYGALV